MLVTFFSLHKWPLRSSVLTKNNKELGKYINFSNNYSPCFTIKNIEKGQIRFPQYQFIIDIHADVQIIHRA